MGTVEHTTGHLDDRGAVRDAVLHAGIDITVEEGAPALTVRRLATAANTSTMSVYTYFGSLGGVVDAVVEHGFALLGRTMSAAPRSGDALVDLFGIALAYLSFAREQPRLYAAMFQPSTRGRNAGDRAAFPIFLTALAGAEFDPDADPAEYGEQRLALAAELWSALHGNAMLRIAGHLDTSGDTVADSLLVTLAVGNGIDRAAAQQAIERAHAAT